jgi:1-acyl-sn-glycerol-3-phosphate acyltransferase
MTKINLPDRLVVMANHQAYTDWMYLWILACYAGHSRGVIILLKEALRNIPIVGWGMVSFLPLSLSRSRLIEPCCRVMFPHSTRDLVYC